MNRDKKELTSDKSGLKEAFANSFSSRSAKTFLRASSIRLSFNFPHSLNRAPVNVNGDVELVPFEVPVDEEEEEDDDDDDDDDTFCCEGEDVIIGGSEGANVTFFVFFSRFLSVAASSSSAFVLAVSTAARNAFSSIKKKKVFLNRFIK